MSMLNKIGLCTARQLEEVVDMVYDDMSALVVMPEDLKQSVRSKIRMDVEGDYCLLQVESGLLRGYVNLAEMPPYSAIEVSVLRNAPDVKNPSERKLYSTVQTTIENRELKQPVPMWDIPPINLSEGGEVRVRHVKGGVFPIFFELIVT